MKQHSTAQHRDSTIDILRFVLAFLVVCIHFPLFENNGYAFRLFHSGICRIAVPIFFIINGFYFNCNSNSSILKWLKRVFLLYGSWLLIYSYFWFSFDLSILSKTFIIGYFHLWYVSAMIGAGLLTYIFRKNNIFSHCVFVICLLVGIALQYYSGYISSLFIPYYRNFIFFGFPFFYLGYYLKSLPILEIGKKYNIILIALGIALLLTETTLNYIFKAGHIEILASTYLLCPFVFIFCYNSKYKANTKQIALFSSSIFFIHKFVGDTYYYTIKHCGKSIDFPQIIDFAIIFILCMISALFIIKVNKKLKFIL